MQEWERRCRRGMSRRYRSVMSIRSRSGMRRCRRGVSRRYRSGMSKCRSGMSRRCRSGRGGAGEA